MISESLHITGTPLQKMPKAAEQVDSTRRNLKEDPNTDQQSADSKKIQAEELLSQIKSLTEDGLYSVRFENDERSRTLVVKIVDTETQEVIRQVPAEELLGMKAAFAELQGNLIDTTS